MRRHVVVGAGIVGLATAWRLGLSRPDDEVVVVEKEDRVAAHQTGHNSGVLHAGVYYRPGSLRARLCVAGRRSMIEFCEAEGVAHRVCGKLIAATTEAEVPRLRALHERARANGLTVTMLTPEQAGEHEPALRCVAAMHVADTGVADFAEVCRRLATLVEARGGRLMLNARVTGLRSDRAAGTGATRVETTAGDLRADTLVNCAGLHADRVARMAGLTPGVRIVPFRGEYADLRRPELVRGLIYPVPDPALPFLGVHLTRGVHGDVHAGPNAVLALAREGYRWRTVSPRDLAEAAAYPGLWRLARRHLRYGVAEVRRSLSRRRFAAAVARLVPDVSAADLTPAPAGVRAQAVLRSGALADDFLIECAGHQVHVLNAPSPAATSALEIARHIVARLPG